jgi:hypothetical protein
MKAMFQDLVNWLESQFDAEERDASAEHEPGCRVVGLPEAGEAAMLVDPDLCTCRVRHRLLDFGARRRLLDDYEQAAAVDEALAGGLELAVRDLALAYADRRGYHEEWRP